MSEKGNEEPNKSSCDLNETNEEGEILTLSDILNEQREIDEVKFILHFKLFSANLHSNQFRLIQKNNFFQLQIRKRMPFWVVRTKISAHIHR